MTDAALTLDPGHLSWPDVRRCLAGPVRLSFPERVREAVSKSHALMQNAAAHDKAVYGVNTGFGLLAKEKISSEDLTQLQRNLVLSHAAGVGPDLPQDVVRLAMVLKINSLARGYSGVSQALIERLVRLLDEDALPCIPAQGSVGASGDLAPLAHMAGVLLGVGRLRLEGEEMPAGDGLRRLGFTPLSLGPKEGLALLNGTQISTALALKHGLALWDLFEVAVVVGALSVDALKGSDAPFDPRLHDVRGQVGQKRVAAALLALLEGSAIRQSHSSCERVQDPYSLRCQPQVMGAALDFMVFALERLLIEANAVSDNPVVFAQDGDILSGGNFHAEPVAFAADSLAMAASEVGALSERRIALLIDPALSGLPAFLVPHSGLNSGFMVAQVTAAALASENKHLAHPASIDSLPTSANQEDHVSMATFAASRLGPLADNIRHILGIELLAATQGIDFHRPLKTSRLLQKVRELVRAQIPFLDHDRYFAGDISKAEGIIRGGHINHIFRQLNIDWPDFHCS